MPAKNIARAPVLATAPARRVHRTRRRCSGGAGRGATTAPLVKVFPKDFAATEAASDMALTLRDAGGVPTWSTTQSVARSHGRTPRVFDMRFSKVHGPQRLTLDAVWKAPDGTSASNAWPVWVFPVPGEALPVEVHPSAEALARELRIEPLPSAASEPRGLLARRLDAHLLQALQTGTGVLLIPDDWRSPTTYLNFTGIDDYADVDVSGEKIGSVGDRKTRQTAFEMRVSLDVSRFIEPGRELQISVAVYDWFGAGGIFRPVTLSTVPLSDSPPILR